MLGNQKNGASTDVPALDQIAHVVPRALARETHLQIDAPVEPGRSGDRIHPTPAMNSTRSNWSIPPQLDPGRISSQDELMDERGPIESIVGGLPSLRISSVVRNS